MVVTTAGHMITLYIMTSGSYYSYSKHAKTSNAVVMMMYFNYSTRLHKLSLNYYTTVNVLPAVNNIERSDISMLLWTAGPAKSGIYWKWPVMDYDRWPITLSVTVAIVLCGNSSLYLNWSNWSKGSTNGTQMLGNANVSKLLAK